jgi:hypothetical protein
MNGENENDEAAEHFERELGRGNTFGRMRKPGAVDRGLAGRERREASDAGPALDGRRARGKGERKQIALRVRPEFYKLLQKLVAQHKSSQAEVIEFCVEHYADLWAAGKKSE